MKLLVITALLSFSAFAGSQQQSPSQNSQDVPAQKPGSDHPDVSKQRKPARKSTGTDSQQQKADVPDQKPGSDNPDLRSQRQTTPKKKKHDKSTNTR